MSVKRFVADAQWPAQTPAVTPLGFCVRDAAVLVRRDHDGRATLPDAVPEGSTVDAPEVGWCHWLVGALLPASHPASMGTSAAAPTITARRSTVELRPWRITACSPREIG